MGFLSRTADLFYTFRFLRLLTTPWEDTTAFELGLIDSEGNPLKKPETSEERSAYNTFHRLVFNIKRLLNHLPAGKTRIASYITALWLLKEHTGMSEDTILRVIQEGTGHNLSSQLLAESATPPKWNLGPNGSLVPGSYSLLRALPFPSTGEILALPGSKVLVSEGVKPVGSFCGHPFFEVIHVPTCHRIHVCVTDISRSS